LGDYWTPANPNAAYPLFTSGITSGGALQTRGIFLDASYLRLKNVEIGFNFNAKLLKELGISAFKLTLSGNDLILWSKIPDDREQTVNIFSQTTSLYPTLRRINVGLNVNF
jgi:hypothetical protein